MARKNIAVLDLGSSRISVMMGTYGLNETINVKGYGETDYAGFMEGEFLSLGSLAEDIKRAITKAEQSANQKITHLYVGVPAEFSAVTLKQASMNFYTPHKITDNDITDLFNSVEKFDTKDVSLINRSPIYYVLDDGERIIKAKGKVAEKFSALISFTFCDNNFLAEIKDALSEFEIEHVEFFSEQLAESLYLVEPEKRDSCAVLIDTGFLTTSVSTIMGDGLLNLQSFSLGAGHILSDICEAFGVNLEQAEELRRGVNLNEDVQNEIFEVEMDDGEVKQINVKDIQDIIAYRSNQIAKMVAKCLDQSDIELLESTSIYLTGGGLSYIEGITDVFAKALGKDVVIAVPKVAGLEKPYLSSTISLLDLALKKNKQSIGLFFIKIFKRK